MSYVDIVICIGSLLIPETWPPIYRGQEGMVRDRLKASQVYTNIYFWKDRDGNLEGGWIGFYKFYLFFSQVLGYADNKEEPNN
jgi:hypothetical protein